MTNVTVKQAVERLSDISSNFQEELLDHLRAAAPEGFTEGKLDLKNLAQLTGGAVENKPERFAFTWAGAGLSPRPPSFRREASEP